MIPNYFPLREGMVVHFNKLEFPSHNDVLCQVWLKCVRCFLRRCRKCKKFRDRQIDGRQTKKNEISEVA